MTIADLLLPEFDQEMATTRRVLERVPEDKFSWKPHDKSMPFGGVKQSGWGRESGVEGLSAFLETKSVYTML